MKIMTENEGICLVKWKTWNLCIESEYSYIIDDC